MPESSYLRKDLDRRLLAYASRSWNTYQAVHGLQQLIALVPIYTENLAATFGPHGIGEPRRMWGVVADLVSAMTGALANLETLVTYGFKGAARVGHIIDFGGDFALASSPVMRRLHWPIDAGIGVDALMQGAAKHDRMAKKLLVSFREELRAYDREILEMAEAQGHRADPSPNLFVSLLRSLPNVPEEFPNWDERPMFLDEQRAFLEYLCRYVGAEVIADALLDEDLGRYLLRNSGYTVVSPATGKVSAKKERLRPVLRELPFHEVAFRVGNAALAGLHRLDPLVSPLERFYAIEDSVASLVGVDVSEAFAHAREVLVDEELEYFMRPANVDAGEASDAPAYDWPELGE